MGHVRDRRYAPRGQDDVLRLLAAHPFAWLVSAGGEDAAFTPLPLRAECDAAGHLVALRGHLARRNPHVARLRRDGRAQALVMGPQAYVSASWLDDRTQAPSWNYVAAMFDLDVVVSEEPEAIRGELDALVTQMEAGRPGAWGLADMGERYARLASGVSALRGTVREVRATFKLGQDEARHDFAQLLAGLQGAGEASLVAWMQAFAGDAEAGGERA
ncbi:FMN-binding negative transcriptional regulator [Stenotrophomonas mori]|uniref:FMN-binding negative transcriptional regulator n=1 Tax=Stenotrophomonas mori TaxID=2871096 RepID=A0ABT0SIS2_9GAMM|nr:FMN-binding negative transcriptional regulator [Stenotrophomonas mori]MCL7715242.1 FMN-binding negative transcriptional regulator [Stenotrophomonas mori]